MKSSPPNIATPNTYVAAKSDASKAAYMFSPSYLKWLLNTALLLLLCAIGRKIYIGHVAMRYVQECSSQVQYHKIVESQQFHLMVNQMSEVEPILVLILNQHALNMTFNWLCNTQQMKGVHASVLIVTLDTVADRELAKSWPGINRLNWVVPCLQNSFNYGDGQYQLFYLFRANLARALLHLNKSFWMVQQDTFWHRNLLHLDTSTSPNQPAPDIIFDRAAEGGDAKLCAGGYYLVHSQPASQLFFQHLAADLEQRYVPDNAYMTALCASLPVTCAHIPFSTITNWIWLHEPGRLPSSTVPMLIQFDGDTKLGGKLAKMRSLGFYFLQEDGRTCNGEWVHRAMEVVEHRNGSLSQARSYSHWQFGLYQAIIDLFYGWEGTEWLLNAVIFPYAHYFMVTL